MGAADIVPGVSGGTVAFITGIYEELIYSLKSISSPQTFNALKKAQFQQAFLAMNGFFLMSVFLGVLTAIAFMSGIIIHLMTHFPIQMSAVFFGLIGASIWLLARHVYQTHQKQWYLLLFCALGIGLAFGLGRMNLMPLEVNAFVFFLGGFIAICAMILPGISGSFLLLMLGLYQSVLEALSTFNLPLLMAFGIGCLCGLLSFSHLLALILKKFPAQTHVFLIGLLIGSLDTIWPWKQVVATRTNSSGEEVPMIESNVMPWVFESLTGQPSVVLPAVFSAFLAFVCILALDRLSKKDNEERDL